MARHRAALAPIRSNSPYGPASPGRRSSDGSLQPSELRFPPLRAGPRFLREAPWGAGGEAQAGVVQPPPKGKRFIFSVHPGEQLEDPVVLLVVMGGEALLTLRRVTTGPTLWRCLPRGAVWGCLDGRSSATASVQATTRVTAWTLRRSAFLELSPALRASIALLLTQTIPECAYDQEMHELLRRRMRDFGAPPRAEQTGVAGDASPAPRHTGAAALAAFLLHSRRADHAPEAPPRTSEPLQAEPLVPTAFSPGCELVCFQSDAPEASRSLGRLVTLLAEGLHREYRDKVLVLEVKPDAAAYASDAPPAPGPTGVASLTARWEDGLLPTVYKEQRRRFGFIFVWMSPGLTEELPRALVETLPLRLVHLSRDPRGSQPCEAFPAESRSPRGAPRRTEAPGEAGRAGVPGRHGAAPAGALPRRAGEPLRGAQPRGATDLPAVGPGGDQARPRRRARRRRRLGLRPPGAARRDVPQEPPRGSRQRHQHGVAGGRLVLRRQRRRVGRELRPPLDAAPAEGVHVRARSSASSTRTSSGGSPTAWPATPAWRSWRFRSTRWQ